jgi:GNAT superfamily N-acetyltransferase
MLTIRPFRASDQVAARALIEDALGDHFGHIDRDANPDLADIYDSYANGAGAFFVAERNGEIVGTTGLIIAAGSCRIVRVAVARQHRRTGVASALLVRAVEFAKDEGIPVLVAHTQPEWPDAVGFYRSHGFEQYGQDEIDVHFRRRIL